MVDWRSLVGVTTLGGVALGELVFTSYDVDSVIYGSRLGEYDYCCYFESCYIPNLVTDEDRCFRTYYNNGGDDRCYEIPFDQDPQCAVGQYYVWSPPSSVESARGTCTSSQGPCSWKQKQYSWGCYDCPAGYEGTRTACRDSADSRGACVGCSNPEEVLQGSAGNYMCVVPGLTCDIVDNLAEQYRITSSSAPATNGYYHQILNLACLRSNCKNPACDQVRKFANPDPECKNLEGSFKFEQAVFSTFATPPDEEALARHAAAIQSLTEALEDYLLEPMEHNAGLNPALVVAIILARRVGPLDVKTIATGIAGTLHFMNDLAEAFYQYIEGLVRPQCQGLDVDVHSRLEDLTREHDLLFKCAVAPGFTAEQANNNLPFISGEIAKLVVPIAATLLRSADIAVAELCIGYTTGGEGEGEFKKRQLDQVATVESYFETIGAILPVSPSIRHNIRNWAQVPFEQGLGLNALPGLDFVKVELAEAQDYTVSVQLLSTAQLFVPSRDADLDPSMIQLTLSYPNQTAPTAPLLSHFSGKSISVVGPILNIKNPATEIIIINETSALPSNFYDPAPSLQSVIDATRQAPVRPDSGDTTLLYRAAKLSLSYVPSYTQDAPGIDPAEDITIFDLVLGEAVPNVRFSATSEGGVYEADLTLDQGIWAGPWSGGGIFALCLAATTPYTPPSANSSASSSVGASSAPVPSSSPSSSVPSVSTVSTSSSSVIVGSPSGSVAGSSASPASSSLASSPSSSVASTPSSSVASTPSSSAAISPSSTKSSSTSSTKASTSSTRASSISSTKSSSTSTKKSSSSSSTKSSSTSTKRSSSSVSTKVSSSSTKKPSSTSSPRASSTSSSKASSKTSSKSSSKSSSITSVKPSTTSSLKTSTRPSSKKSSTTSSKTSTKTSTKSSIKSSTRPSTKSSAKTTSTAKMSSRSSSKTSSASAKSKLGYL